MSLKSLPIPPVPEEMARVAHAVFPRGNVFMQVRDALGTIYTDEAFADLFPIHGQPALAPWRLALVTVFQFMEGLTDRQTADAVRGSDHGLRIECALGGGPRLGSRPRASRVGRALWRTALPRTLAERGGRAQAVR